MASKNSSIILRIYFALVSLITLVILIFSVSDMINIALKTYVLPSADAPSYGVYCGPEMSEDVCEKRKSEERERAVIQKQQSVLRDISMLIVSAPLFWLHFRIAYADWIERKEEEDEDS